MSLIGGALGYRLLHWYAPRANEARMDGSAYRDRSKLRVLLGDEFLRRIRGKTVLDFGCGAGSEAIELAQHGATSVIGVDIQRGLLAEAQVRAVDAGVSETVRFSERHDGQVDYIVSLDSFEHFADPAAILHTMASLLAPGGEVLASFGPTWYHPLGGHLFSVFPWAHLLFTEETLIRWRSDFKSDGARSFAEVAGGLNRMTIARFERLVAASPLAITQMECVPIRRLQPLAARWNREFTTAIVRCVLVRRADVPA